MWEPDPAWEPLRTGGGHPATVGVWAARDGGRRWIVKRLAPPDETALHDPGQAGYWRREAEVALHADSFAGPGLVLPEVRRVDEDADGVTVWTAEVPGEPPPALFVARALGRFASSRAPDLPWVSRSILAGRLALAELRDGWPTLRRTTLADVTEELWLRRTRWLSRVAAGPQGQVHGDVTPGNMLGRRDDDVVAVDWQAYGTGPVGADLGYFALSCREDFAVLLTAFVDGLRGIRRDVTPEVVADAARVTAVYTAVSRAEWALARAAGGEDPLAATHRHPSVAPHLRALQRQLPQLEALLRR
ncbi:MAG TPA: phosphotransferase [Marmoricola sp.]|jgi:hypothetical protein|nr:phosphotransferase [Marmoricola sp.]